MIDNAEDLDLVMPMYNLLEYGQKYSMTLGSLWNYYKNETNDIDNIHSDGELFKYKTKIIGKTEAKPVQPAQPAPDQDGTQLP